MLTARGMASTAFQIPSDVRPLTEADKAAVAATAPVLAEHGVTITNEMYKVSLSGVRWAGARPKGQRPGTCTHL